VLKGIIDMGEQMGMVGGHIVSAQVSKELKITLPVFDLCNINYRTGFYCCTGFVTAIDKTRDEKFIFYSGGFLLFGFIVLSFIKDRRNKWSYTTNRIAEEKGIISLLRYLMESSVNPKIFSKMAQRLHFFKK
jgi:hypothetical protein